MGQKVNPIGLRLGINKSWQSRWFAEKNYAKLLEEADLIFWVGEGIETFMEKPLESIVKNAEVCSINEGPIKKIFT